MLSAMRNTITIANWVSGNAIPNQKWTTRIVTTCPMTASQRSWTRRSRFFLSVTWSMEIGRFPLFDQACTECLPATKKYTYLGGKSSSSASNVAASLFEIRNSTNPAKPPFLKRDVKRPPRQHYRQSKPGQRIEQMVVRKSDDGQSSDRQCCRICGPIDVDKVRRDLLNPAGCRDRGDIARIPTVGGRVIVPQKSAARLGHTQKAGQRRLTRGLGSS